MAVMPGHEECPRDRTELRSWGGFLLAQFFRCDHTHTEPVYTKDFMGEDDTLVAHYCRCCDEMMRTPV